MSYYSNTHVGTVEIVNDPSQFSTYPSHQFPQHHQNHHGHHYQQHHQNYHDRGGFQHHNTNRFIDFNKPWISSSIRAEIMKKKQLSEAARRSKTAESVAALQTQSDHVETLISEAKIAWLADHPELEADWLQIIAR